MENYVLSYHLLDQSQLWKVKANISDVVLVFLLWTLNIFHTFFLVLLLLTLNKYMVAGLLIHFKPLIHFYTPLTLSWWRAVSYRKQSTDLLCKSMDWFLYDIGPRHERVNIRRPSFQMFSGSIEIEHELKIG